MAVTSFECPHKNYNYESNGLRPDDVWQRSVRRRQKLEAEKTATLRRIMRAITGLPYYVRNSDLLRSVNITDPVIKAAEDRTKMVEKIELSEKEYIRKVAAKMRQLANN